jgi:hypothetical protein
MASAPSLYGIGSIPSRRRTLAVALAAATACAFADTSARAAPVSTLCVGAKPGCFSTVQAAVDAAQDGDTIRVGPGTFAGGITILKNVALVGTGAGATTIQGGGPVITIGTFDGDNDLQVAISRVTITEGVNDTAGFALGGGVAIPQSAGQATGATVTIADSVIAGNRAAPEATFSSPAPCGGIPFDQCAFAGGGGIANSGTLTLTDTRVIGNVAGSAGITSYAFGGGISNGRPGTLTLIRSVVSGNRATVSAPNGRFTDGGGIVSGGTLTIGDSVVSGNTSSVAASVPSFFPFDVEEEANAGGIYLPGGSSTTVSGSRISGNTVASTNTAGDVEAEAGGIDSDGLLLLVDSSVDHNTITGSVPASSGFLAEADGGGLQIQGDTTLRRSSVTGNSISSTSATGTALGSGGGLFNLGASLTLERTEVTANRARASGNGGVNLGGGIANVQFFGPAPVLTLTDSVVTANGLSASAGIASLGGGVFNLEVTSLDPFATGNPFSITRTHSVVEGNRPDQCAGC